MYETRWIRRCLVSLLFVIAVNAQSWDLPGELPAVLSLHTEGKLKLSVEQRVRYERRTGTSFGKDPDIETGLVRTRLGMSYKPARWLKLSGMVQDSRAPWYG